MRIYEFARLLMFPIMPALLGVVRKDLKDLIKKTGNTKKSILDVGGRKSPYTIGLNLDVTLLDIPRESEAQEKLNLGITSNIIEAIKSNRSNISNIILEDMTKSTQQDETYDGVICVEVIEHVPNDSDFVKHISRVIKKGGWAYFTTPNGDYIKNEEPNYNPDHVRHYRKEELKELLENYFDQVEVHYAIKTGKYRKWGLPGYTLKRPFKTLKAIIGNVVNRMQSQGLEDASKGTAHLIAVGIKFE